MRCLDEFLALFTWISGVAFQILKFCLAEVDDTINPNLGTDLFFFNK